MNYEPKVGDWVEVIRDTEENQSGLYPGMTCIVESVYYGGSTEVYSVAVSSNGFFWPLHNTEYKQFFPEVEILEDRGSNTN